MCSRSGLLLELSKSKFSLSLSVFFMFISFQLRLMHSRLLFEKWQYVLRILPDRNLRKYPKWCVLVLPFSLSKLQLHIDLLILPRQQLSSTWLTMLCYLRSSILWRYSDNPMLSLSLRLLHLHSSWHLSILQLHPWFQNNGEPNIKMHSPCRLLRGLLINNLYPVCNWLLNLFKHLILHWLLCWLLPERRQYLPHNLPALLFCKQS